MSKGSAVAVRYAVAALVFGALSATLTSVAVAKGIGSFWGVVTLVVAVALACRAVWRISVSAGAAVESIRNRRHATRHRAFDQHQMAPHIGQRDESRFQRLSMELLATFFCAVMVTLSGASSWFYAWIAFRWEAGPLLGAVLLAMAVGCAVGAVAWGIRVAQGLRWIIRDRRLAKRRAARWGRSAA